MNAFARRVLHSALLVLLFAPAAYGQGPELLPFEPDDTLEEIQYKIGYNGYAFTVDHNWVFDMPADEKASFFSRRAPLHPASPAESSDMGPLADRLVTRMLPASFDWRNYGGHSYIGDIRDQGNCGSCYAFGAVAAAEGTYNFAMGLCDGSCADFSEAFVAFCLSDYYSGFSGCSGANYDYEELDALVDYGVCGESEYPYTDYEQPCKSSSWSAPRVQFQSWHRIPCSDVDAIKTAIMTYGIVDAAVYAGSAFQGYSGGVYEDTNTSCSSYPCYYTPTNHAISLVGWDDSPPEGGGGCWILRNSWGTSWGEGGYMRIRYTSARVSCEACYLVYTEPPTPTPTPTWNPAVPTYTPTRTPTRTPTAQAQTVPFEENFEGTWAGGAPQSWSKEYLSGATDWTRASGGFDGNPPAAHGGSYNALFFIPSYAVPVTRLISPRLDFGSRTQNTRLDFWYAMEQWWGDQDELAVYYRTSASGPWTMLWSYSSSVSSWTERSISLPDPGSDYYICFQGIANWGYGVCIDDVLVTGESPFTQTPTQTPTGPTPTPTTTPTVTCTPTVTFTPTATPVGGQAKLAVMKEEGAGDANLYLYNGPVVGDWGYWDASARNPSAYARDLWVIPHGNDAAGVTAVGWGALPDRLFVMKADGSSEINLYLYNGLVEGDWSYWDCASRNPSPLAQDAWVTGGMNDPVGIAAVDDMNADARPDLALLKLEGAGDMNLYCYNALVPGDWTYWDCASRNPSPLARDFWMMPSGNDAVGMAAIDVNGGGREVAIIKENGAASGDLNLYLYRSLAAGDWTYWDCISRNPSPLARDLWIIPMGNDAIGMAAMDADGDGKDELSVLKLEGAGDVNLYCYNAPVAGDWTYWDAVSRNPSPLARDLWRIPTGNDAIGVAAPR